MTPTNCRSDGDGVHTSVQPAALLPPLMILVGTVMRNAEARSRDIDGQGHMVPVLIVDIELATPTRNHHRSEQRFPEGHHAQCEAAARRYKKGMRVRVDELLAEVRTIGANTQHIHVLSTEEPA